MSPPFQLPDVDCVVVNRDGGEAFFAALSSLKAQAGVDASILVVDNASQPAERERLAREFGEARLVAFSRNLGFAGAANEGIARTRSAFVLLVNNDAVLAPDYAARLAARLALDDRLAAVQGLVLSEDGRRVDTAGLDWNRRGEAVPILAGAPPEEAPRSVFEVSGVSATATLYRRAALESVASARRGLRELVLRVLRGRGSFAAPRARGVAFRLRPGGPWPPRRLAHGPADARLAAPSGRRATGGERSFATSIRACSRATSSRSCARTSRTCGARVEGSASSRPVWPRLPVLAWRSRDRARRSLLSRVLGPWSLSAVNLIGRPGTRTGTRD